ncbi:hypothetical protein [Rhodococcus aetherivorans]|uniref:Cap15 family cyclic dinucleotide receptor domain-containing protein n=1 Tax=Rhodococcus aetherivorans TaxID=191292 RepID=UPI001E29B350|nr:hypothetical protein [Rhodococcus aetherivorans]UGQ41227.1 hypothetical protein LRQ66_24455 [Rhodococcus aetherivorans]
MRPTTLVRLVVLSVGLAYTAVLALSGVNLDNTAKLIVGWFPAVASVALLVWDLWGWRLPLLNRLTHRPRIDGLWEVTLTPTEESHIPEGGNRGPIPAYIVINQSYWSLHVRQMTVESGSDSKSFFWDRVPGDDVERLSFLYQNDPRPEHRARSPRHLGTCSFDTARLVPQSVRGVYFTDRYTQGEMDLRLVDRSKGYTSYQEAAAHVADLRSDDHS